MPQISQSSAFAKLSSEFLAAFKYTIPKDIFRLLTQLDIHSDSILAIRCGIESLARLIGLQRPVGTTSQQFADCNPGRQVSAFENANMIEGLLDWPAITIVINEFTAWRDNPERILDVELLRSAAANIRRRCSSLFERFPSFTTDQKIAILDMANCGNMASHLAHFAEHGVSSSPDFRKLVLNTPNPSGLESFAEFRKESLGPNPAPENQ